MDASSNTLAASETAIGAAVEASAIDQTTTTITILTASALSAATATVPIRTQAARLVVSLETTKPSYCIHDAIALL